MFHRRAKYEFDEDEIFGKPSHGYAKSRRGRLYKKLSQFIQNKLVVSIAYCISILLVYQYFQIRAGSHTEYLMFDSMNTPQYFLPDHGTRKQEPEEIFEQFRYRADAIMLPNAPYKHIKLYPDVRATQLIYLDAVRQHLERTRESSDNTPPVFDIHWVDWIDMSDLQPLIIEKPNCFVAGVLGSNLRTEWNDCIDADKQSPDSLNFYFNKPATKHESEYRLLMRAKTYLHAVAPIPKKLIFITGELAFVVKTKSKSALKENGMVEKFISSRLDSHKDIILTEDDMRSQPISASAVFNLISEQLGRDLRNFNTPSSKYADVKLSDFDTLAKRIKKSKQASLAAREGRVHFYDALVAGENDNFQAPYDWRFFQRTLTEQRHRAALHHTARAWLSFSANLGFISWLDEDSLISWSVNGMLLPWEKVIKFKMPSKEFLKLATYNYSLIIDDPMEGHGSYLLDLSPFYMERARLNDPSKSPDTVDARFIDTRTGVYIELTGLMFSDSPVPRELIDEFGTKEGIVNSADGKFYHKDDLLPVKRTLFEGKVANVPGNALKLISHSHMDIVEHKEFENYKYQGHLRLWISKSKCNYVPLEDVILYENGGSSFIGACHDLNIWSEFNQTSEVSLFRKTEINASEQKLIGAKDQFDSFYPDYSLMDRIELLSKEFGYPLP